MSLFISLFLVLLRATLSFQLSSRAVAVANRELHLSAIDPSSSSSVAVIDWKFFDDVYLITTTQKDSQRLERTRQELEKVDLWERVNVREFKPDDEDRVRGCYTSHIAVLKEIQMKFRFRDDYRVLVLEDNLEITLRMDRNVVNSVGQFVENNVDWDVFHLAYMMYVPGLSLKKLPYVDVLGDDYKRNIVQMLADSSSSVGTSAYGISKSGVEQILTYDEENGFTEAIPNIMALLFPQTRYATYPMVFHRAAKVGSLVNPQLDAFRKVMFSPIMYTTWERLMVNTGLQNNQLFPGVTISLFLATITAIVGDFLSVSDGKSSGNFSGWLVAILPLGVALWGASLFKPGNTGAGFAKKTEI